MNTNFETAGLVRDKIRMSWLNLNAREVSIQPLNGSNVVMTFRELRFEGLDLSACVDQALEKLDGRVPGLRATIHDTSSRQPQISAPTEDVEPRQDAIPTI